MNKLRVTGIVLMVLSAAAILFTGCPNATGVKPADGGGGSGGNTPEYTVNFSVDGGNGTLTAVVDGAPITTGAKVQEGKTVKFTAVPANATTHDVDFWTVSGGTLTAGGTSGSTTAEVKAGKADLTVKVKFKLKTAPPSEYTVNFSADGGNGTLTAAVDGKPITTGTKVQAGKTVKFTAAPNAGYEVNTWMVSSGSSFATGGTSGGTQATLIVNGGVSVTVTFKPKGTAPAQYTVNFSVDGGHGTLTATVDGNSITAGAKVQAGKTVKFTAVPASGYRVEQWTNGGTVIAESGSNTTYSYTVTENADIKVKFTEILFDTAVLTLSPDKKDIRVKVITADGSPVTVEGCTETELPSGTETGLHAQGIRVTLKGKITELHCGWNQLTALNVQGLTALKGLVCNNNKLTALNVQGLTALKGLYCHSNQLTTLNVQGLTALEGLDCGWNQLTALNVQGLTALEGLDCGNNQLTALNVQGLTALKKLLCAGNQLTALDVQGLTALEGLDCGNNQLTALNVQGLTALKTLVCSGNKLNAAAFEQLFTGLPQREESDEAKCILYSEQTDVTESNNTNFTAPPGLAGAFNTAKTVKKWKMYKLDASGNMVEI